MFSLRYRQKILIPTACLLFAIAGVVVGQVAQRRMQERARIVRGTFDLYGNVLAGAGFTVELRPFARPNPGPDLESYVITFDRSFRDMPTILGTYKYMSNDPVSFVPQGGDLIFMSVGPSEAVTEPFPAAKTNLVWREISFIAAAP